MGNLLIIMQRINFVVKEEKSMHVSEGKCKCKVKQRKVVLYAP